MLIISFLLTIKIIKIVRIDVSVFSCELCLYRPPIYYTLHRFEEQKLYLYFNININRDSVSSN